ncbi:MAG: hypothetical protein JF564_02610 [Sphingomonas sp.]|nr:hypothetical protein [Sphingomonas sp.]
MVNATGICRSDLAVPESENQLGAFAIVLEMPAAKVDNLSRSDLSDWRGGVMRRRQAALVCKKTDRQREYTT